MAVANIPIREVQSPGMVTDSPPSSLTASAWSMARNMTFSAKGASRSPHLFKLSTTNTTPTVSHIVGKRYSSEGFDDTYVFGPQGECGLFRGSEVYQSLNPDNFVATSTTNPKQYTSCVLADVLYVNREDIGIRYVSASGANFASLPNLDSSWTCLSLRAYKDYLIALNVTKAGVSYSNMVKWSDAALNGQVPGNWDYTLSGANKSSLAGENPLAEMTGPIYDGLGLGNSFVIYGRDEVWIMEDAGNSTDVFTFRRQFGEGIRGTNCAVEVNGIHYVFGNAQIYQHDGITPVALQARVNNATVYTRMDPLRPELCFVTHDAANKVILFCYPTEGSAWCNEALAYNYVEKTAAFVDLPNVKCANSATPYSWYAWTDDGSHGWDYDAANDPGVTWSSDANAYIPSLMMGGAGANKATLWRYTLLEHSKDTPDPDNNYAGVLERTGVVLDTAQMSSAGVPLQGSKQIDGIVPLIGDQSVPITVEVAGSMTDKDTLNWRTLGTFDASTQYRLNGGRCNGRCLSFRITVPASGWATVVGYDLGVIGWGNR